jgi:hypothetical protein
MVVDDCHPPSQNPTALEGEQADTGSSRFQTFAQCERARQLYVDTLQAQREKEQGTASRKTTSCKIKARLTSSNMLIITIFNSIQSESKVQKIFI